jgi:tRNA nucleotidyltransferase/poly(A) polymerase
MAEVRASAIVDRVFERFGLQRLLGTLRESGEDLYLVGGAVRDSLINPGVTATDIDIMTSAEPEHLQALFSSLGAPRINRHGNWRFILEGGRHVDLISTRRFYGQAASVEKALNYFDTSINAIAVSLDLRATLVDPLQGARDIAAMQLVLPRDRWIVGNAFEDVHVLLRAMRLLERTGFRVVNPEITIPHRARFDEVDWTDLKRLNGISRSVAERSYARIFKSVSRRVPAGV